LSLVFIWVFVVKTFCPFYPLIGQNLVRATCNRIAVACYQLRW